MTRYLSFRKILGREGEATQLKPGDVIATGTPGGVGDKRKPPLYMRAGYTVEVSIGAIGAIGTITNRIIDEL